MRFINLLVLWCNDEKNPADRTGLGLGAPNLEKIIAALRAKGFEPGPIEAKLWDMTFVVRDPDGRRVEVKHELSEGDPEFEEELKSRIESIENGSAKFISAEKSIETLKRRIEADDRNQKASS